QRLVKIRIAPKGKKVEVAPKPAAAPIIAEEVKPKAAEAKPKVEEAKPVKAAPAPEIKQTTATVECPACNKSFDVPVDAKEGVCPHCNAELLFEDVIEEPKKEKKERGLFWKKKSQSS
ncbi:MAG: hypothetical protein PHH26_01490, partial [Candidatus Thermoplasmatota archaeon]|nr:hypothetical protein [Candidatus Thermoplasmatota archaeon]